MTPNYFVYNAAELVTALGSSLSQHARVLAYGQRGMGFATTAVADITQGSSTDFVLDATEADFVGGLSASVRVSTYNLGVVFAGPNRAELFRFDAGAASWALDAEFNHTLLAFTGGPQPENVAILAVGLGDDAVAFTVRDSVSTRRFVELFRRGPLVAACESAAAAGTPLCTTPTAASSGAVWRRVWTLEGSDADEFGASVSVLGRLLAIGVPRRNLVRFARAWVSPSSGEEQWETVTRTLQITNATEVDGAVVAGSEDFGRAVFLRDQYLVVGATTMNSVVRAFPSENGAGAFQGGAFFVFDLPGRVVNRTTDWLGDPVPSGTAAFVLPGTPASTARLAALGGGQVWEAPARVLSGRPQSSFDASTAESASYEPGTATSTPPASAEAAADWNPMTLSRVCRVSGSFVDGRLGWSLGLDRNSQGQTFVVAGQPLSNRVLVTLVDDLAGRCEKWDRVTGFRMTTERDFGHAVSYDSEVMYIGSPTASNAMLSSTANDGRLYVLTYCLPNRYILWPPPANQPRLRQCEFCPLGRYSRGGSISSASCRVCENAALRPTDADWIVGSTCQWRCRTGFFGDRCLVCTEFRRNDPNAPSLPANARWVDGQATCEWACLPEYTLTNTGGPAGATCVPPPPPTQPVFVLATRPTASTLTLLLYAPTTLARAPLIDAFLGVTVGSLEGGTYTTIDLWERKQPAAAWDSIDPSVSMRDALSTQDRDDLELLEAAMAEANVPIPVPSNTSSSSSSSSSPPVLDPTSMANATVRVVRIVVPFLPSNLHVLVSVAFSNAGGRGAAQIAAPLYTQLGNPAVPQAPSTPALVTTTASQIEVRWQSAAEMGGVAPIDFWVCAHSALNSSVAAPPTTTPNATHPSSIPSVCHFFSVVRVPALPIGDTWLLTGVVAGLRASRVHWVRVAAVNALGASPWSPWSSGIVTSSATPPSSPRNVSCVPVSGSSLRVQWDAPADLGGADVTYSTAVQPNATWNGREGLDGLPGFVVVGPVALIAETQRTLSDLLALQPYAIRLYAWNVAGRSPEPPLTSVCWTGPMNAPSIPSVPNVAGSTSSTVQLTWTPPSDLGGASAVSYTLLAWYNLRPGGTSLRDAVSADGTVLVSPDFVFANLALPPSGPFVVRALNHSTAYRFAVLASNAAGQGKVSNVSAVATTKFAVPPSAPGRPILADATGGSLTIRWTAPADSGGAALVDYRISKSSDSLAWTEVLRVPATSTQATVTGFAPLTPVFFRVIATTFAGPSPASERSDRLLTTVATPPSIPPTPIVETTSPYSATSQSISLRVVDPLDLGGAPLRGFAVRIRASLLTSPTGSVLTDSDQILDFPVDHPHLVWDTSAAATITDPITGRRSTILTIHGLLAAREYEFAVAGANTAVGRGDLSGFSSPARTRSATVPSSPRQLSLLYASSSAFRVDWRPPTSRGGSPVIEYIAWFGPFARAAALAAPNATEDFNRLDATAAQTWITARGGVASALEMSHAGVTVRLAPPSFVDNVASGPTRPSELGWTTTAVEATAGGFDADVLHVVAVQARTAAGVSAWSAPLLVRTRPGTAPSEPGAPRWALRSAFDPLYVVPEEVEGGSATPPNPASIGAEGVAGWTHGSDWVALTWDPPVDAGGLPIQGYLVLVLVEAEDNADDEGDDGVWFAESDDPVAGWTSDALAAEFGQAPRSGAVLAAFATTRGYDRTRMQWTNRTGCVLEGLAARTTYRVRVLAVSEAGQGRPSEFGAPMRTLGGRAPAASPTLLDAAVLVPPVVAPVPADAESRVALEEDDTLFDVDADAFEGMLSMASDATDAEHSAAEPAVRIRWTLPARSEDAEGAASSGWIGLGGLPITGFRLWFRWARNLSDPFVAAEGPDAGFDFAHSVWVAPERRGVRVRGLVLDVADLEVTVSAANAAGEGPRSEHVLRIPRVPPATVSTALRVDADAPLNANEAERRLLTPQSVSMQMRTDAAPEATAGVSLLVEWVAPALFRGRALAAWAVRVEAVDPTNASLVLTTHEHLTAPASHPLWRPRVNTSDPATPCPALWPAALASSPCTLWSPARPWAIARNGASASRTWLAGEGEGGADDLLLRPSTLVDGRCLPDPDFLRESAVIRGGNLAVGAHVRVRVAAVAADGTRGPFSDPSAVREIDGAQAAPAAPTVVGLDTLSPAERAVSRTLLGQNESAIAVTWRLPASVPVVGVNEGGDPSVAVRWFAVSLDWTLSDPMNASEVVAAANDRPDDLLAAAQLGRRVRMGAMNRRPLSELGRWTTLVGVGDSRLATNVDGADRVFRFLWNADVDLPVAASSVVVTVAAVHDAGGRGPATAASIAAEAPGWPVLWTSPEQRPSLVAVITPANVSASANGTVAADAVRIVWAAGSPGEVSTIPAGPAAAGTPCVQVLRWRLNATASRVAQASRLACGWWQFPAPRVVDVAELNVDATYEFALARVDAHGSRSEAVHASVEVESGSSALHPVGAIRPRGPASAPPALSRAPSIVFVGASSIVAQWTLRNAVGEDARTAGGLPIDAFEVRVTADCNSALLDPFQTRWRASSGATVNASASVPSSGHAGWTRTVVVDGRRRVVAIEGLAAITNYTVAVRARNRLGAAAAWSPESTRAPTNSPEPPSGLGAPLVGNISSSMVDVHWAQPVESGGLRTDSFLLHVLPNASTILPANFSTIALDERRAVSVALGRHPALVTLGPFDSLYALRRRLVNLAPRVHYAVGISATNFAGSSVLELLSLPFVTANATLPGAPGTPAVDHAAAGEGRVSEHDGSSVALTWEAPLDLGGQPLQFYVLNVTWQGPRVGYESEEALAAVASQAGGEAATPRTTLVVVQAPTLVAGIGAVAPDSAAPNPHGFVRFTLRGLVGLSRYSVRVAALGPLGMGPWSANAGEESEGDQVFLTGSVNATYFAAPSQPSTRGSTSSSFIVAWEEETRSGGAAFDVHDVWLTEQGRATERWGSVSTRLLHPFDAGRRDDWLVTLPTAAVCWWSTELFETSAFAALPATLRDAVAAGDAVFADAASASVLATGAMSTTATSSSSSSSTTTTTTTGPVGYPAAVFAPIPSASVPATVALVTAPYPPRRTCEAFLRHLHGSVAYFVQVSDRTRDGTWTTPRSAASFVAITAAAVDPTEPTNLRVREIIPLWTASPVIMPPVAGALPGAPRPPVPLISDPPVALVRVSWDAPADFGGMAPLCYEIDVAVDGVLEEGCGLPNYNASAGFWAQDRAWTPAEDASQRGGISALSFNPYIDLPFGEYLFNSSVLPRTNLARVAGLAHQRASVACVLPAAERDPVRSGLADPLGGVGRAWGFPLPSSPLAGFNVSYGVNASFLLLRGPTQGTHSPVAGANLTRGPDERARAGEIVSLDGSGSTSPVPGPGRITGEQIADPFWPRPIRSPRESSVWLLVDAAAVFRVRVRAVTADSVLEWLPAPSGRLLDGPTEATNAREGDRGEDGEDVLEEDEAGGGGVRGRSDAEGEARVRVESISIDGSWMLAVNEANERGFEFETRVGRWGVTNEGGRRESTGRLRRVTRSRPAHAVIGASERSLAETGNNGTDPTPTPKGWWVRRFTSLLRGPVSTTLLGFAPSATPAAPTEPRSLLTNSSAVRLTFDTPRFDGGCPLSQLAVVRSTFRTTTAVFENGSTVTSTEWSPEEEIWSRADDMSARSARILSSFGRVDVYVNGSIDPMLTALADLEQRYEALVPWPLTTLDGDLRRASLLRYRVRSRNEVGWGPWSAFFRVDTLPSLPTVPQNFSLLPAFTNPITLGFSWQPPADDGGRTVTRYQMSYSSDGGSRWQVLSPIVDATGLQGNVTNLDPGTDYLVRVAAVSSVGMGRWTDPIAARTEDPRPCPNQCSPPNGQCHPWNGQCTCTRGYALPDCGSFDGVLAVLDLLVPDPSALADEIRPLRPANATGNETASTRRSMRGTTTEAPEPLVLLPPRVIVEEPLGRVTAEFHHEASAWSTLLAKPTLWKALFESDSASESPRVLLQLGAQVEEEKRATQPWATAAASSASSVTFGTTSVASSAEAKSASAPLSAVPASVARALAVLRARALASGDEDPFATLPFQPRNLTQGTISAIQAQLAEALGSNTYTSRIELLAALSAFLDPLTPSLGIAFRLRLVIMNLVPAGTPTPNPPPTGASSSVLASRLIDRASYGHHGVRGMGLAAVSLPQGVDGVSVEQRVDVSAPSCDIHGTCDTCTADQACGWCSMTARCTVGTPVGPAITQPACPVPVSTNYFHAASTNAQAQCPGECAALSTCSLCAARADCRWCESSNSCLRVADVTNSASRGQPLCPASYVRDQPNQCPAVRCSTRTTQRLCLEDLSCGWCRHPTSPVFDRCAAGDSFGFLNDACPAGGTYFFRQTQNCTVDASRPFACEDCLRRRGCGWCNTTLTCGVATSVLSVLPESIGGNGSIDAGAMPALGSCPVWMGRNETTGLPRPGGVCPLLQPTRDAICTQQDVGSNETSSCLACARFPYCRWSESDNVVRRGSCLSTETFGLVGRTPPTPLQLSDGTLLRSCPATCFSMERHTLTNGTVEFGSAGDLAARSMQLSYKPFANCSWIIDPVVLVDGAPRSVSTLNSGNSNEQTVVQFRFSALHLAPGDTLSVFRRTDTSNDDSLIVRLTGDGGPVDVSTHTGVNRVFESDTAFVYVVLAAYGGSGTGGLGFKLQYSVETSSSIDVFFLAAVVITSVCGCLCLLCGVNKLVQRSRLFRNEAIIEDDEEGLAVVTEAAQRTGRGAPDFVIHSFPAFHWDEQKKDQTPLRNFEKEDLKCSISLEDFEENDLVRVLPCLHAFKVEQIDPWLRMNKTCPLCKRDAVEMFVERQSVIDAGLDDPLALGPGVRRYDKDLEFSQNAADQANAEGDGDEAATLSSTGVTAAAAVPARGRRQRSARRTRSARNRGGGAGAGDVGAGVAAEEGEPLEGATRTNPTHRRRGGGSGSGRGRGGGAGARVTPTGGSRAARVQVEASEAEPAEEPDAVTVLMQSTTPAVEASPHLIDNPLHHGRGSRSRAGGGGAAGGAGGGGASEGSAAGAARGLLSGMGASARHISVPTVVRDSFSIDNPLQTMQTSAAAAAVSPSSPPAVSAQATIPGPAFRRATPPSPALIATAAPAAASHSFESTNPLFRDRHA